MKPEDRAREVIDAQLSACGWVVQSYAQMNIAAARGVAVREFPLTTGSVDYLLYVEGRVIGTVEAKPAGHTLSGVEVQSTKYSAGLPEGVPSYRVPLPFAYESTGTETQFTNLLEPDARSRSVFTFHRPEELVRLVGLAEQVRGRLQHLPPLITTGLWRVQADAVRHLEASLAANRPRALIQMATGSGKTFTACTAAYRLIKDAGAKRILFLVDRNNLGKQALTEFQQYVSPITRRTFVEEYPIQRLTRNTLDPAAKVVVTTVQRLYSMLKGEPEFDEAAEEDSMFETSPLLREPVPVAYNPAVPIETFDVIVIDECHRSIYNVWRQVLEYFDAFLIGLTATPTPQTLGFFRGNLVQDYSHERAVADGVNVGYDVYRIRTQVTETGATLVREGEGFYVPVRDRRTRARRLRELEDDLPYTGAQLDRDVVNESQLRLVIRTFRDRLVTDIFPGRTEVPKTLVFAKHDNHAEDIVRVIREEFGKGNDFCQKITSKTTGKKPDELLNEFRNSYNPRIAVTVDMIATGTDVKALECLMFLRNINSATYFEQMKGRGVRVILPDDLESVTPGVRHKTRFVIVDAVGVCENDKTTSKPLDRQPSVPLRQLLQMVAQGRVHEDLVSTLAVRLARLDREISDEQRDELTQAADGAPVPRLVAELFTSLDPDLTETAVRQQFSLAADQEPTEEQWRTVEHARMTAALRPFHRAELRERITTIKAALEQVIDETTPDTLLQASFDADARTRAQTLISDFRAFIAAHKDELEALQVLYHTPYRAGLRYRHVKDLKAALERPPLGLQQPVQRLWRAYEAVEPDKVKGVGGRQLVDLIALVRHALHPDSTLVPVETTVEHRYQTWLSDQALAGVTFSADQRQWLDAIKDHIATSLHIEPDDFDYAPFSQLGGLGKAHTLFGDQLTPLLTTLNERLAA